LTLLAQEGQRPEKAVQRGAYYTSKVDPENMKTQQQTFKEKGSNLC
jgi:hypothetical protein